MNLFPHSWKTLIQRKSKRHYSIEPRTLSFIKGRTRLQQQRMIASLDKASRLTCSSNSFVISNIPRLLGWLCSAVIRIDESIKKSGRAKASRARCAFEITHNDAFTGLQSDITRVFSNGPALRLYFLLVNFLVNYRSLLP